MQKLIENFTGYLAGRPRRFIVAAGIALVLLVVVPDYILGPRIGISIFYLLPLFIVTWYAGQLPGLLLACISAAAWMSVDFLTRGEAIAWMTLWNGAVRLGFFLIVVLLLNGFKREQSSAREDYLTGLGNRRYFFETADAEMKRSERYGHSFSVAYIDVDGFKSVNDRYGHSAGDRLLIVIAQTIAGHIRVTDKAARLGGDEFAVLLPESGAESALRFFSMLHKRLTEEIGNGPWPVTFSIGVVTFFTPPESIDTMIHIVDRVMYSAKAGGKNLVRYEIFGNDLRPE